MPRTEAPIATASIRRVEELNIGHALICRAVMVGLDGAVREMLAAMATARAAAPR